MIDVDQPPQKKDPLETTLGIYEGKLISARVYNGTPDGYTHGIEANAFRACLYSLGLMSEAENHKIVHRAELKAAKCKMGDKQ